MPFFRDPNLERDEDEQSAGGSVQLSSGGMQAGPDGDPNKGSGASATQSGSRFTNLDSYLKNNDAKGFGEQFGQKIESGIDQARANMDQAAGQVRNQIGSFTTPSESDITGTVEKAKAGNISDDDAKAYQGWTNQKYQGPQGLADNAQAQGLYWGQADKAKTEAGLAGKESGRFALLDQYFGRPNYSMGQKSLDNLLIQNGGGFNNQAQLQDKAASLVGYGNTQAKQISNEAAAKAAQLEASRKAARGALGLQDDGSIKGGAIGDFQTDLDGRVKNFDARSAEAYQNALADVKDDALDAPTVGGLGLADGANVYDLDLAKYISQSGPVDRAKLATGSDYAKYQALSKLAGLDPTYLDPSKSGMAETQDTPRAAFNKDAVARDLKDREASYRAAVDQAILGNGFSEKLLNEWKAKYPHILRSAAWDKPGEQYQVVKRALQEAEKTFKPDRKLNAPSPVPVGDLPGPFDVSDPGAPPPTTQPGGEPLEPTTPIESIPQAPGEPAYQYAGHEWDDPDLMSMFDFSDPKNPKVKVR